MEAHILTYQGACDKVIDESWLEARREAIAGVAHDVRSRSELRDCREVNHDATQIDCSISLAAPPVRCVRVTILDVLERVAPLAQLHGSDAGACCEMQAEVSERSLSVEFGQSQLTSAYSTSSSSIASSVTHPPDLISASSWLGLSC